jgi:predicted metal-dependent hydrolase
MQTILINNLPVPYTIVRAAGRKRTISLMMERSGHLQIRAPLKTKPHVIERLIHKNSAWILKKIAANSQQPPVVKHQFLEGEKFSYLGQEYPLQICEQAGKKSSCQLVENVLQVNLAHHSGHAVQHIAAILKVWYRHQAHGLFLERITEWQQCLGVKAARLKISQARRRWGSCSEQNTICLNWRLMMAPLPLIDYVVVHELCHITHKNHSKAFWQLLASIIPDYAVRKKILRQEGGKWLEDF